MGGNKDQKTASTASTALQLSGSTAGFTLVELILYVALVGILLTAGAIFASDVVLGFVKGRIKAKVQSEARFAIEKMRQEIVKAKSIESSVIITGGDDNGNTTYGFASAELYSDINNSWSLGNSLNIGRSRHTMTALSSGKVLIAGGNDEWDSDILADTELYDPVKELGIWSKSSPMNVPRRDHTATRLPDGRVLVAGGLNWSDSYLNDAEIYNPDAGIWNLTNPLSIKRNKHSSVLLADGQVLIAGGTTTGGVYLNSSEIYNPATGNWTSGGNFTTARIGATIVPLNTGNILLIGGYNGNSLSSTQIYTPGSGWSNGPSLGTARRSHTATILKDGRVLVVGGRDSAGSQLSSSEIYNPVSNTWGPTGSLQTTRDNHTAALLPDGRILVTGGFVGPNTFLSSSELYDPSSGNWSYTTSIADPRSEHTAVIISQCRFLLADNLTHLSFNINGNGSSQNVLQMCTKSGSACGSADSWQDITSPDTEVTNFTCANISSGTSLGEEAVKINMTLKNKNPGGKKEFDAEATIETSISLRL